MKEQYTHIRFQKKTLGSTTPNPLAEVDAFEEFDSDARLERDLDDHLFEQFYYDDGILP
jgi:hypothetical protein